MPSTLPEIPTPGIFWDFSAATTSMSFAWASVMGWVELFSRAASRLNNVVSSIPSFGINAFTVNLPSVNVPVLSKRTWLTCWLASMAWRFRTNSPFWAPIVVERETTNGIANPNACGQAITKTVTMIVIAVANPWGNQAKKAIIPTLSAA